MFPEAVATFVRLKEGTFTGGNFLYLEKHILREASQLLKGNCCQKTPVAAGEDFGNPPLFFFLFVPHPSPSRKSRKGPNAWP